MDVAHLVQIAQAYGGGQGAGLGPGLDNQDMAGLRPGAAPLRRRSRGQLLRLLGKKEETKCMRSKQFKAQAAHSNSTGRNRTRDFLLPEASSSKRVSTAGRGKWKQWTPEAVLRTAFANENMAVRHVADQVDGGSASHSADCKLFAAELIMLGQQDGLSKFLEQAKQDSGSGTLDFAINNIIFDETELEINLHSFGLGSWSILASHSQMSFRVNGRTIDNDIIRPPMAIPNKQAVTMWSALCSGEGGLWPGLSYVDAKVRAILTTCDAAPANIKLLKHLQCVLDDRTLLLPFLCMQHRTGNVVERVTKLLGVLTGSFAVAKTLQSGTVVKKLTKHVRDVLAERLQVLDRVPPGLADEWASSQVCARAIVRLVRQGQDEGAGAKAWERFFSFFHGPWTGHPLGSRVGWGRFGWVSDQRLLQLLIAFSCCVEA